jgi:signal transduction histidine kinase
VAALRAELKQQQAAVDASRLQLHQTELALNRAQSELRLVSAALLTSQEMERKRIASELHDSIGQALNALSFCVGVALDLTLDGKPDGAADMLRRLGAQTKDTVEEVRRIAMDLRPATLDDLGIVGTLSWFFREFRTIYPRLALRAEVDLEESDVAETLRTPIYRVVQEAISNAVKHAAASEIRVALERKPPRIVLEIEDNGRGFALAGNVRQGGTRPGGMGLTGMRDRVEFSGGDFLLHSVPGQGTKIRACWPLYAAQRDDASDGLLHLRDIGE